MANNRRRLVGRVVSNSMDKTVVVLIESSKTHRVYKKVMKRQEKMLAHDESNTVEIGSVVQIVESRPLSKRKRWVVEQVIAMSDGTLVPVAAQKETNLDELLDSGSQEAQS